MILSRGRGYLFIHIPKTGGTSLALALEERAKADDEMLGDTPKARKRRGRLKGVEVAGRLWKHSTLRDLRGLVTEDDLDTLFIVTLVRNPWDRCVSYYHWLRDQTFDHPAVSLAKAEAFKGFLTSAHTQATLRSNPYASYVTDWHGQHRCGCYIRLEHLADDLQAFEDHLGFALNVPHVNQSERESDYRAAYDDSTRDLIGEICADDIARFGYKFDSD
ncbi:sulfotransferase family 2 domain-containing protein [Shimia ponticola]|uniref:sulfotransferase family 2 domain-containing protein n=1 Tax=Shimia ponticola TaxID=2582893 RepID=UPI0011BF3899|nr:sulfotransferase family 2 domain-containing protein [Shimia ponticola]